MNDGSLFSSNLYIIVTVILLTYVYQASKEVCEAFRVQVSQSIGPSPLQANTTLTNPWVNIKVYMVTNVTKVGTCPKTTDITVGDISTRTLFDVIYQHLSNRWEPKEVKDVKDVKWGFTHLQFQVLDYTCHSSSGLFFTWHDTEIPRKLEDQNMCQNENRWTLPDGVNMPRESLFGGRREETWPSTFNKMKDAFFVDIRYILIFIDVLTSSKELVLFITVLTIVLCSLSITTSTGLSTHVRITFEHISLRNGLHLLPRSGVITTLDRFTLEFVAKATLNTSTLFVVKGHKIACLPINTDDCVLAILSGFPLPHGELLKERRVAEDKDMTIEGEKTICDIPGTRKTAIIHDQMSDEMVEDNSLSVSGCLFPVRAKQQLEVSAVLQKICRWNECKLASKATIQRRIAHRNEVYQKRLLKVKVQHRKHHRKKFGGRRRQKSDSLGYYDVLQGHGRMGRSLQVISQPHNVGKVQLRQQHGWNWTGGLLSDKLGVETGTGTEGSQWNQWTQRPMGSWISLSGDIGLWSVWRY